MKSSHLKLTQIGSIAAVLAFLLGIASAPISKPLKWYEKKPTRITIVDDTPFEACHMRANILSDTQPPLHAQQSRKKHSGSKVDSNSL